MIAFEELPVSDSVTVLTPATFEAVGDPLNLIANVVVEDASIRFTYDGETEPTDVVGTLLNVGDIVVLDTIEQVRNFKAFTANVSPLQIASLKVHYENNNYGFKERDAEWQQ